MGGPNFLIEHRRSAVYEGPGRGRHLVTSKCSMIDFRNQLSYSLLYYIERRESC